MSRASRPEWRPPSGRPPRPPRAPPKQSPPPANANAGHERRNADLQQRRRGSGPGPHQPYASQGQAAGRGVQGGGPRHGGGGLGRHHHNHHAQQQRGVQQQRPQRRRGGGNGGGIPPGLLQGPPGTGPAHPAARQLQKRYRSRPTESERGQSSSRGDPGLERHNRGVQQSRQQQHMQPPPQDQQRYHHNEKNNRHQIRQPPRHPPKTQRPPRPPAPPPGPPPGTSKRGTNPPPHNGSRPRPPPGPPPGRPPPASSATTGEKRSWPSSDGGAHHQRKRPPPPSRPPPGYAPQGGVKGGPPLRPPPPRSQPSSNTSLPGSSVSPASTASSSSSAPTSSSSSSSSSSNGERPSSAASRTLSAKEIYQQRLLFLQKGRSSSPAITSGTGDYDGSRQKRKRESSSSSSGGSSSSYGISPSLAASAASAAAVPVSSQVMVPQQPTVVAPDDDIEDENRITVFSVVKVKKRKVNGEKKPLDFGIVISIHNKGESYTIEFSSDDHVETHVPSRKVKLANFERKKRRQANKKARSKRKERKKRRRLETLHETGEEEEEEMEGGGDDGGSSRHSKKRSKKNNGKKGLAGMETQKKRKKKTKSVSKSNKRSLSSKRSKADQPKNKQRPFYCSQLVTVLWRDKYYSGDIVTDHEDGSYAILYTDFETSNYEESVRRRRIKKRDLKPTKKDLASSLEGRRVRILWANEAAYLSGVVQGWGTGRDKGKHVIEYDDGDIMAHDFSKETVQLEPCDPDAVEKSPASSEAADANSVKSRSGDNGGKAKQVKGKGGKKVAKTKPGKAGRSSSKIRPSVPSAEFDVGDIVQCKALNSRWYRAIINAVQESAGTYTVLYERSNTVEENVSRDRVQTYVKARDRLRNGTPRNSGTGKGAAKGKGKGAVKARAQKRRKKSGAESSVEQTSAEETGDSSEEIESEESESESSESDSSEDETVNTPAATTAAKAATARSKGKKKGKVAKKDTKARKTPKVNAKTAKTGNKGTAALSVSNDKKKVNSRSSRAARAAKLRVLSEAAQKRLTERQQLLMALEMSAAEAPDPVPYQEKLGISPEDLAASMAEINKPEILSVTVQGQENGVKVRSFQDEDMPMLINLDVVTAHEILGDKARIFGRLFFEKHCSPNRTTAMSWRTLTATIQGVPVGFVMYFHYKLRVGTSSSGPALPAAEASAAQQRPQQKRGGYIDLFWILVHPNHRQVGVGSALIRETQRQGKEEWPNVDQVRLYVMDSNVKALSLYRTHGFERISRRENYPEIGTASYRMVKKFEKTAETEAEVAGDGTSLSTEVSTEAAAGKREENASRQDTDVPAGSAEAKVSSAVKMFSPRIEDLLSD